MRSLQTKMSWMLLAAMLVSLPGGATGHFVCSLGMAEAGPACPQCHGQANAQQSGEGFNNSCCKFVAGQSTMDSNLAPSQVENRALAQLSLPPADASLSLTFVTDRDAIARANQSAVPRTSTSGYLSNFLRL